MEIDLDINSYSFNDLKQLLNTPDYESESTDIQNYNNNIF